MNIGQLREKYPYIVLYGRHVGSYSEWIDGQVEQAARENAPEGAYIRNDALGEWETVESIMADQLRERLGLEPFQVTAQNVDAVAEWAGNGEVVHSGENATTVRFVSIWDSRRFVEYLTVRRLRVALHEPLTDLNGPALITVTWKD